MQSQIIDELSKLASNHKLVPFLGAGCSKSHLNLDWDTITLELSELVNKKLDDNLDIVQYYVEKYGKNKFCEFLKEKLTIDNFNDKKGFVHLIIQSFNLGVLYTTNQDNVMEKCIGKYHRNYKTIININDLADSFPSDNLYIKFHGDINDCKSVVFSRNDYNQRMGNKNHFLNIKLRHDLLTKSLFFIGYSLRDDNVNLILKELNELFGDNLPNSYMLAWEHSKELENLCREYGIKLIDPLREFPNDKNDFEMAFENFLTNLLDSTIYLKRNDELNEMFRPKIPPSMRVVTQFEINALKKVSELDSFDEIYNISRKYLDRAVIPHELEKDVIHIFEKLSFLCSNENEFRKLKDMIIYLFLENIDSRINIMCLLMVATNVSNSKIPMPIHMKGLNERGFYIFIPIVFHILDKRNQKITDSFRRYVTRWIEDAEGLEDIKQTHHDILNDTIEKIWKGKTTLENPLNRRKRLMKSGVLKPRKTFGEFFEEMMERYPKIIKKPYE